MESTSSAHTFPTFASVETPHNARSPYETSAHDSLLQPTVAPLATTPSPYIYQQTPLIDQDSHFVYLSPVSGLEHVHGQQQLVQQTRQYTSPQPTLLNQVASDQSGRGSSPSATQARLVYISFANADLTNQQDIPGTSGTSAVESSALQSSYAIGQDVSVYQFRSSSTPVLEELQPVVPRPILCSVVEARTATEASASGAILTESPDQWAQKYVYDITDESAVLQTNTTREGPITISDNSTDSPAELDLPAPALADNQLIPADLNDLSQIPREKIFPANDPRKSRSAVSIPLLSKLRRPQRDPRSRSVVPRILSCYTGSHGSVPPEDPRAQEFTPKPQSSSQETNASFSGANRKVSSFSTGLSPLQKTATSANNDARLSEVCSTVIAGTQPENANLDLTTRCSLHVRSHQSATGGKTCDHGSTSARPSSQPHTNQRFFKMKNYIDLDSNEDGTADTSGAESEITSSLSRCAQMSSSETGSRTHSRTNQVPHEAEVDPRESPIPEDPRRKLCRRNADSRRDSDYVDSKSNSLYEHATASMTEVEVAVDPRLQSNRSEYGPSKGVGSVYAYKTRLEPVVGSSREHGRLEPTLEDGRYQEHHRSFPCASPPKAKTKPNSLEKMAQFGGTDQLQACAPITYKALMSSGTLSSADYLKIQTSFLRKVEATRSSQDGRTSPTGNAKAGKPSNVRHPRQKSLASREVVVADVAKSLCEFVQKLSANDLRGDRTSESCSPAKSSPSVPYYKREIPEEEPPPILLDLVSTDDDQVGSNVKSQAESERPPPTKGSVKRRKIRKCPDADDSLVNKARLNSRKRAERQLSPNSSIVDLTGPHGSEYHKEARLHSQDNEDVFSKLHKKLNSRASPRAGGRAMNGAAQQARDRMVQGQTRDRSNADLGSTIQVKDSEVCVGLQQPLVKSELSFAVRSKADNEETAKLERYSGSPGPQTFSDDEQQRRDDEERNNAKCVYKKICEIKNVLDAKFLPRVPKDLKEVVLELHDSIMGQYSNFQRLERAIRLNSESANSENSGSSNDRIPELAMEAGSSERNSPPEARLKTSELKSSVKEYRESGHKELRKLLKPFEKMGVWSSYSARGRRKLLQMPVVMLEDFRTGSKVSSRALLHAGKVRKFSCRYCTFLCLNSRSLKYHIETSHVPTQS